MMGPVQVLVVGFDQPAFSGEILAAALLGRADDEDEGEDGEAGRVDIADVPVWSLADAVPSGSVAAVALIEHLWAKPLTATIREAGGAPLEETWLAPVDLAALEALLNQREPGEEPR